MGKKGAVAGGVLGFLVAGPIGLLAGAAVGAAAGSGKKRGDSSNEQTNYVPLLHDPFRDRLGGDPLLREGDRVLVDPALLPPNPVIRYCESYDKKKGDCCGHY